MGGTGTEEAEEADVVQLPNQDGMLEDCYFDKMMRLLSNEKYVQSCIKESHCRQFMYIWSVSTMGLWTKMKKTAPI